MKKLLQSQKGSSFAYVLVVISILLILSGSLITLTVANYRLGLIKGGRNTAFYFADGAIDEALAEIEEISHRAEIAASETIQKEDADFKKTAEWSTFEKWLEDNQAPEPEGEIGDLSDDASQGTGGEGEDETYLSAEEASALYSEALNKEFQKQYLLNLLQNGRVEEDYKLIDVDNDAFITENDMVLKYDGAFNTNYLTSLKTIMFDPKGTEGFEEIKDMTISVTPEYKKDDFAIRLTIQTSGAFNIYNKGVEVVVDLVPPTYDYVTVTSLMHETMRTNDILENALTARKDIVVVGGELKTEGDVYALGSFKNTTDVSHYEKGGLVIGYDTEVENDFLGLKDSLNLKNIQINGVGKLNVGGHLRTAASVKPSHKDSTLNVTGSIYADSFIVNAFAGDTQTTLQENMFLMDDLSIQASGTAFNFGNEEVIYSATAGDNWVIDDSLLTYLDGVDLSVESGGASTVENGRFNSPDLSSSVRVAKDVDGSSINLDFLYIPGVSYIDIYRNESTAGGDVKKYFQTGESFTTGNNFFFYQKELEEQEERTKEVYYTDGTKDYGMLEYVDGEGKIQESPKYKVDHFLNSVREEYEKPEEIRDTEIVPTKDKTIMTIRSMSVEGLTPEQIAVKEFDDNYALGVFMGNGKVYNPNRLKMQNGDFKDIMLPANISSDLQMGLLGYRDYRAGKLVTRLDESDPSSEMLDQYIDFSESSKFTTINKSGLLVVLEDDEDKDVYINVPAQYIPEGNHIVYNGSKFIRSLVATKGDIYIYNDGDDTLTIKGTLLAGGSIVSFGSGKKVIDNVDESKTFDPPPDEFDNTGFPVRSRGLAYNLVSVSDALKRAFHTETGRKLVVEKYAGTKIIPEYIL